jgi:UDP-sugar pyrophosphorylase
MNTAPPKLKENLSILSPDETRLVEALLRENQQHLFASWDSAGTKDDLKHKCLKQLQELDRSCAGGLQGYLSRARTLLAASRAGENPFKGWTPQVPEGVHLEPFTPTYSRYEDLGLPHVGKVGFVLVAGGLGERLGYNGIKVELPVETVTHTTYLGYYCSQILAMQSKYGHGNIKLPLAIMVSDDTNDKTMKLLESNNYFGMQRSQIALMKQGKVPALMSNNAAIAMASEYEVDSKPHGHGDVHYLLHSTGIAKNWLDSGIEWITFFQDTNALAFFTLPAMLGVSVEMGLEVNSLAVPRVAKQSVGALAKLTQKDGREMTINVEYNQLDPLLRSTISKEGDVNDPKTGLSLFPGNINQLLFRLQPYVKVLDETNGLMPEFVNPKYKDETKTLFKKPTRLECMMQDYPRLLGKGSKVGFTMAPTWICYSPCKNNAADAAAAIASGIPSASTLTAESDQYQIYAKLLTEMGCSIESDAPRTYLGIQGALGPRIVLHPSFLLFPNEIGQRFPNPSAVSISNRSTLIICGDVIVEALSLDGSLSLEAIPGTSLTVNIRSNKQIKNAGHEIMELDPKNMKYLEKDRMRGYFIQVKDMLQVTTKDQAKSQDGKYYFDGVNLIDASALDTGHSYGGGGNSASNPDSCWSCFNC